MLADRGAKKSGSRFWSALGVRYVLVYVSVLIGATLFSNWRFFPSVDFNVIPENWGKFVFVTFLNSVFYMLLAQILAQFLGLKARFRHSCAADLIFVVLYLVGPISFIYGLLPSDGRTTFSFGVSEGEVIKGNVVTELGRRYFFMLKMKEVFHMAIFLVMRFLCTLTPLRTVF